MVGCGFIGSHVVIELSGRGRPFSVLTRSHPSQEVAAAIEPDSLMIGDASDPATLKTALEGASHVVYCAGGKLPAQTEESPELSTELTLAPIEALLTALRDAPEVGLTYISSGGTVYGEPARVPVPEDAPTEPRALYGKLHLACEKAISRAGTEFGLRACLLRCSTLYGEHQQPGRGQGAVVTFLDLVERGEEIVLFGDGAAVRDYLYAGDVARVIVDLLAVEDLPTILNVGSGRGTSLAELVALVERELGKRARVASRPERGFEIDRIVLDIQRLQRQVTFEPLELEQGIARTHGWLASRAGQAA